MRYSISGSNYFSISFIVALFVLLLISGLSYQQVKSINKTEQAVNHSYKVQLLLEQLISFAKDAETGLRGFIVTNDSSFLQPYNSSLQNLDRLFRELQVFTKDNIQQQENLALLKPILDKRIGILKEILQNFGRGKTDNASGSLMAGMLEGKKSMDLLRWRVNKMIDLENQLLKERQRAHNSKLTITPFISLLLLSFSLVIFISGFYKINKDMSTLRDLNKEILFTKEMLEVKNKELDFQNEEKEKRAAELIIANKELSAFTYIASHDLQEPLRKTQLFISRIFDNKEQVLSEKNMDYFLRMQSSAKRMQILINDLLAFSRVNETEKDLIKTDLNIVVANVLEELTLAQTMEETNTTITCGPLPEIQGISFLLEQLFTNLITNSIKYSGPDRAPIININSSLVTGTDVPDTKADAQKKYYKITVADNGIGFEQQYAEKIFTLFQRLHDKHTYSGSGIGLTICKKIVETHRGFITSTGIPNQGATFAVYFPAL